MDADIFIERIKISAKLLLLTDKREVIEYITSTNKIKP